MNYIYGVLYLVPNFLLPIVLYPYLARTIGSAGLGEVGTAVAIVMMFSSIAQAGLPVYGVKAISKLDISSSDYNKKRDKLLGELVSIQAIVLLVLLPIIYWFCFFTLNQSTERYHYLVIIYYASWVFNLEWIYRGLGKFKYLAFRMLLIRCAVLIPVVYFLIDNKNESWIYFSALTFVSILGAAITLRKYKKYLILSKKNIANAFKAHGKSLFWLGLSSAFGSCYVNLDIIVLNHIAGDASSGVYMLSKQLTGIYLAVFGALLTVFLSRSSKLNAKIDAKDVVISVISIWFMPYCFISLFADVILHLFGGDDFKGGGDILRIIFMQALVTSLAMCLGYLFLIGEQKERIHFKSTLLGCVISLVLFIILVPKYFAEGTAIALFFSELFVSLFLLYFCIGLKLFVKLSIWLISIAVSLGGMSSFILSYIDAVNFNLKDVAFSMPLFFIIQALVLYVVYIKIMKKYTKVGD